MHNLFDERFKISINHNSDWSGDVYIHWDVSPATSVPGHCTIDGGLLLMGTAVELMITVGKMPPMLAGRAVALAVWKHMNVSAVIAVEDLGGKIWRPNA